MRKCGAKSRGVVELTQRKPSVNDGKGFSNQSRSAKADGLFLLAATLNQRGIQNAIHLDTDKGNDFNIAQGAK